MASYQPQSGWSWALMDTGLDQVKKRASSAPTYCGWNEERGLSTLCFVLESNFNGFTENNRLPESGGSNSEPPVTFLFWQSPSSPSFHFWCSPMSQGQCCSLGQGMRPQNGAMSFVLRRLMHFAAAFPNNSRGNDKTLRQNAEPSRVWFKEERG